MHQPSSSDITITMPGMPRHSTTTQNTLTSCIEVLQTRLSQPRINNSLRCNCARQPCKKKRPQGSSMCVCQHQGQAHSHHSISTIKIQQLNCDCEAYTGMVSPIPTWYWRRRKRVSAPKKPLSCSKVKFANAIEMQRRARLGQLYKVSMIYSGLPNNQIIRVSQGDMLTLLLIRIGVGIGLALGLNVALGVAAVA